MKLTLTFAATSLLALFMACGSETDLSMDSGRDAQSDSRSDSTSNDVGQDVLADTSKDAGSGDVGTDSSSDVSDAGAQICPSPGPFTGGVGACCATGDNGSKGIDFEFRMAHIELGDHPIRDVLGTKMQDAIGAGELNFLIAPVVGGDLATIGHGIPSKDFLDYSFVKSPDQYEPVGIFGAGFGTNFTGFAEGRMFFPLVFGDGPYPIPIDYPWMSLNWSKADVNCVGSLSDTAQGEFRGVIPNGRGQKSYFAGNHALRLLGARHTRRLRRPFNFQKQTQQKV